MAAYNHCKRPLFSLSGRPVSEQVMDHTKTIQPAIVSMHSGNLDPDRPRGLKGHPAEQIGSLTAPDKVASPLHPIKAYKGFADFSTIFTL